jgi:hypothetical protein
MCPLRFEALECSSNSDFLGRNHLLRIMVKYLVVKVAKKLNFFPNKYSVSKHYSPSIILHQENFDYEQHFKFAFGKYVQAHNNPKIKNTNAPSSLNCIYLFGPEGNVQGGHKLLHLQTANKCNNYQNKVHIGAITQFVINQVHKLATLDGMPKGLKIQNCANQILFEFAWFAGIDFEKDDTEDR